MKDKYSVEQVMREAQLILEKDKTIEEVSVELNIPRSTVGWHMLVTIKRINPKLRSDVEEVFREHKKRGGKRKRA